MIKVSKAVFGYKVKLHFSAKEQGDFHPGFVKLPGTCYHFEEFDQRPKWHASSLILSLGEIVRVTFP